MVKLSTVATISAGQSAPKNNYFSENGIPFIRAGNLEFLINGKGLDYCEKINETNAKICKLKLYPKNAVLFAKSGMSANKGRVYKLERDSYVVSHLAIVVTDSCKLLPSYFMYWLKINSPRTLIKDESYPSISLSDIGNLDIDCPSIEEQQRIVNILDKAEEIRTKKKLANEKLDEFLKSTFIDMFGDPMSNNINIKKEKLGKYLVYVQNGISRRRKIPQNIGNLVFRIKEIRENYIDYSDINRIPLNEKEKDKYKINNNELLFIRVNGNKDYVGRNAVFRGYIEDAYFNDHIMRVKIEERYMNPIYLSRFLNMSFGKEEIRKYIKTSAGQYTINQQGLSSVELTIPPIEQQNQFAKIVQKVEAQKEKNQKVIEQMDNLFNSLMQQAFNHN